MGKNQIAATYIEYLSQSKLVDLLCLFAKDAVVISPVYGTKNHIEFYTNLFADTNNSQITVQGIFTDAKTGNLAIHFDYKWTLKNNQIVDFEVVDILKFNEEMKIEELRIIYDSIDSRRIVEEMKNDL